jgi:hypothetical protein
VTEYTAKSNAKRCPTHPGAVLRDDGVECSSHSSGTMSFRHLDPPPWFSQLADRELGCV